MSQTIKILTQADVEAISTDIVKRLMKSMASGIMDEMEFRMPKTGPKILNDSDPIDILSCSVRLHNTLSRLGLKTIGDIRSKTFNWFWCQSAFGRAAMLEFRTRLAINGVELEK